MTIEPERVQSLLRAPLPFFTAALPGIQGRLKVEPEDFVVEEIPAYEPSGQGEHLFLWIQKRDVSAEALLDHLARKLEIPRDAIGVAGLKDRRAVTRQWVSVPAGRQPRIGEVDSSEIQVLRAELHSNKLKTGHLRGNRFEILIRDVPPDASETARGIAEVLVHQGVPNFFGTQRFGTTGDTVRLGFELLHNPSAERRLPPRRRKFLKRLALSAAQSALFNEVLRRRMERENFHCVQLGDVMQVAASGGLFLAEEPAVEQQRFQQHETLITGPMFGPKMRMPQGEPLKQELAVLQDFGLQLPDFEKHRKLTSGTRRPLSVWLDNLECSSDPHGVRLRFALPSGAYATVVLRELMKVEVAGETSGEI